MEPKKTAFEELGDAIEELKMELLKAIALVFVRVWEIVRRVKGKRS